MNILEHICQSNQEIIIITEPYRQRNILKALSKEKVFKPIRFLSCREVIDKVLFRYEEGALLEASRSMNLKPLIVESLLPYLYTVSLDENYQNPRLQNLQSLKKHLIETKMITYYPHLNPYFDKQLVLVYLDAIDDVLSSAIEKIRLLTECIVVPVHKNNLPKVFMPSFVSIDDEIAYVAKTVLDLHQKGIPLSEIQVVSVIDTYKPFIKAIFAMYEIPFQIYGKHPLMEFETTKNLLIELELHKSEPISKALPKAFQKLNPPSDELSLRYQMALLKTLQPFIKLNATYETIESTLTHALKRAWLTFKPQNDALKISTNIEQGESTDYLFILGCSEGYFPKWKHEDDYLNANEKYRLKRFTAADENHFRREKIIHRIYEYPTVYCTRANSGLTETFYQSSIINEMKQIFDTEVEDIKQSAYGNYGRKFDLLKTKQYLDHYMLFGEEDAALPYLYPTFKADLRPYDNRFKELTQSTLNKLLPETLSLSFTKLNTFFKCRFRYLMEQALKIEDPFDPLAMTIGTLFHNVLEAHANAEAFDESIFNKYLDQCYQAYSGTLTAKEQFFLDNSRHTIKKVYHIIERQHKQSNYQPFATEFFHKMPLNHLSYPAQFVGIIDKIMALDEDNQRKMILIDYKTGSATLKLIDALFGINAQLLYYVILLQDAFKDETITCNGFYEQMIFPRPPKSSDENDPFETALQLNGYTLNDPTEALKIDQGIAQKSYIKGLRFKNASNDAFAHWSKVYTLEELTLLTEHLKKLIDAAVLEITKGTFIINPKRTENNTDLSCQYCRFNDVCYKKYQDYENVTPAKDENTLYQILREMSDRYE